MKKQIAKVRNYLNICTEPPEIISLNRVRDVLKGYRSMREGNNHKLLKNVRAQFTNTKLKSRFVPFSKFILPFKDEVVELAYRQYLLLMLVGTRLNASVLAHLSNKKPLAFPLPDEWLEVLQCNEIKVSKSKSKLLFFLFALKHLIIAAVDFLKYCCVNFTHQFKKYKQDYSNFIYFFGLSPDSLPPEDGSFRYNIIEWYLSWDGREKDITEIRHSVDTARQCFYHKDVKIRKASYLPKIENTSDYIQFVLWGIGSLLISFFFLFVGRLKYAILLREIQKEKIFSLADTTTIGKDYLNNNENMIYRPLWTYAAEQKGARVTLYNWSAGFPDIKGPHGYPPTEIGQTSQNWPIILQWSKLYSDYLQSIISSKETVIKVVPPIYFSDSTQTKYHSNNPIVAVFDVTPQRKYFHDILIPSVEYRTYLIGKQFLEEIYELARLNGFDIMWKRKRNFVITNHSSAYIKFSEKFSKLPGVIEVDPRISAFQLVQQSVGVISMPFTSTSLVAEAFNKPSVYYDPTLKLYKDDRGTQGLPLILGKTELDQWFQSLKNKV